MTRLRRVDGPAPKAGSLYSGCVGAVARLDHGGSVASEKRHPSDRRESATSHGTRNNVMHERRLVGIDLGVASAHTAQVLRADGTKVCCRSCWPRLDSLQELERAALAGASDSTRLEVVMEATGPGMAAHRRLLRPPRPPRLPRQLGKGPRPSSLSVPPRQVHQH